MDEEDIVIETFSQADQNIEPGINSKNTNLIIGSYEGLIYNYEFN